MQGFFQEVNSIDCRTKRDFFYFVLRFSFAFSVVSRFPYSFISLMSSTFLERSFRKVSINCIATCGWNALPVGQSFDTLQRVLLDECA